ncbi:MAG TPA: hypothetical protein VNA69_11385 [Thermoanaerobaculia bacterium]|nr:hypothetical protein [Thermoanaerobaculia bacterium]
MDFETRMKRTDHSETSDSVVAITTQANAGSRFVMNDKRTVRQDERTNLNRQVNPDAEGVFRPARPPRLALLLFQPLDLDTPAILEFGRVP